MNVYVVFTIALTLRLLSKVPRKLLERPRETEIIEIYISP